MFVSRASFNGIALRRVALVNEWPEEVERVAAFLRASGAEARIEEFSVETATAAAAAEAVGCEVGEIVKSLILLCDDRPVLALVPGDRRCDTGKIARAAGAGHARVAHAREVPVLTGFAPGAVAPFPLERVDRVLIDRVLLAHDLLWVGAGSTRHMAVLPSRELVRLTKAAPADLVTAD
jgi:prolyl-tRNA editing enzyme YbaK/EbsC (Cys-tRNA(Pro) deacylase)